MKYVATEARKWVVLGALVLTSLTASLAYGEERTRCEQAYLESGLTRQQMSFEEFREMYSDTLCASSGARREAQLGASYPPGEEGGVYSSGSVKR